MVYLELLLIVALTLVNGSLAMSELAVVSARPARLKAMAADGVRGAQRALDLAAHPGRFLSSVQIGITLVGILAGAISGATLGDRLGGFLLEQGMPARTAYVVGVGAVVTGITYMSLIIGELVPKQIALRNPERIACLVAPAMQMIARLAAPLIWVLDRSGRLVLTLLGQTAIDPRVVTDEEIRTIIAEAELAGVIEPGERQMIAGVMRLGDRPVRQVMTQRFEVEMVNLANSPAQIMTLMQSSPHSRYPVVDGDPDTVIGVLWIKDFLDLGRSPRIAELRKIVRDAPILPESMGALDAIEALRKSSVHMGLVHDEYGHFQGVVTTSDILEAIVGDFADEAGPAEEALVRREDGSFLVSGWMPADEFAEALSLRLPAQRGYDTMAGYLIDLFGRIPNVGETVSDQGWRFEIVDRDGLRIDKALATRSVGTASTVVLPL